MPGKTKVTSDDPEAKLTDQQKMFVEAFVDSRNATQAAIEAGYARASAKEQGHRLLTRDHVRVAVRARLDALSAQTFLEAADVLREWADIATADPRELVSYRRGACRHCHGVDHAWQWRDRREYEAALKYREASKEAKRRLNEDPDYDIEFDEAQGHDDRGGYGYRKNLKPHDDCPECEGDGIERVYVADTRDLSPKGAKLYGGVKQTKDGIQIVMRDQDKALDSLARHYSMFVDRLDVTVSSGMADRLARAKRKASKQD